MTEHSEHPAPWYRHRWPWILMAIPFLTVVASAYTFYLAVTNPDYLVVDEQKYETIRQELRAQDTSPEPELDDGQR